MCVPSTPLYHVVSRAPASCTLTMPLQAKLPPVRCGSTSISAALQAAANMLRQGGRPGVRKFVMLLSDGQQSPMHGGDKIAIDAAFALRRDKSLMDDSGIAVQV